MNPKSENRYPALERVKADIASGDLGKARDRLHGLINSYPDDFSLRPVLADIYWQMKCPEDAGIYWYFVANRSEEMQRAIDVFEQRSKSDPLLILQRLNLRINLATMEDSYAKERIEHLTDLIRKGGKVLSAKMEARLSVPQESAFDKVKTRTKWTFVTIGCFVAFIVAFIVAISLMLIGLAATLDFLFGK